MTQGRQEPVSPIIDNDLDPFGPYWDEQLGEKWEEKKSLTALVLDIEQTPDGLVAIYGLPITDEAIKKAFGKQAEKDLDDKAGRGLPPGLSRWRTLKDGRHVMISTVRRISRAAMARAVLDVQEVIKRGKETGKEFAIVSDSDGNRIGTAGGEAKNMVDVGPLTEKGTDEFILVHNHPSSSPFSREDIGALWNSDIQHMIAAGHDGTIYRASRTDGSPSREELFQRATKEGAQPWDATLGEKHNVTRKSYVAAIAGQYVGFRFEDALGKYRPDMMKRYREGGINARQYSHGLIQLAMKDMWDTLRIQYERSEVP